MRLKQARHNSTSHCHEYYICIYLYIIQDRACQTMPETGYSNISPWISFYVFNLKRSIETLFDENHFLSFSLKSFSETQDLFLKILKNSLYFQPPLAGKYSPGWNLKTQHNNFWRRLHQTSFIELRWMKREGLDPKNLERRIEKRYQLYYQ